MRRPIQKKDTEGNATKVQKPGHKSLDHKLLNVASEGDQPGCLPVTGMT